MLMIKVTANKDYQNSDHILWDILYMQVYFMGYNQGSFWVGAQHVQTGWACNQNNPWILTHWTLGDLNVNFENVIFNLALLIGVFKTSCGNALRWMPQKLTDGKSTLVEVMAWCCQATTHYLNQCWPRSPTPYGVTRPQWVKYCIQLTLCDAN